jgi:hypothetical protein
MVWLARYKERKNDSGYQIVFTPSAAPDMLQGPV